MSCIQCEEVPKRVSNIFKDEELKEIFENLTGLSIFRNVFICDPCLSILTQFNSFREKCIQVYEREIFLNETNELKDVKTECYQEEEIEHQFDHHLLQEEHLEEEFEAIVVDPLQSSSVKPRVRFRYSNKEKLEAIELAEQTSNRRASKFLRIDESCIRKWRHKKELIKDAHIQKQGKVSEQDSPLSKEEKIFDTEVVCEIIDESLIDKPVTEEVKTRRSYSSSEKLGVIAYAEVVGNRQAGKVYAIDESCIRKWRSRKDQLIEINEERGTKRKPNLRFPEIDKKLKAFVLEKLDHGIRLRPSDIKAQSMIIAKELNIDNFKGTSSYVFKFMRRYHIPSNRGKKISNKPQKNELPENCIVNVV